MAEEQLSNTSKVMKGISSQTIVTLVLGLVEIVSFSIMSRLLTQKDFGYFAAITAITAVFSTFSETGIGSAIIQQKRLTTNYINNAFSISLIFGSFIAILLFVLAGPLANSVADKSMEIPLMLMSGTLLLNCLTSINLSIMYRKLQFLRVGLISLVSLVVTTCIAVWLAYEGLGYYAIITKAILGTIITYVLSLLLCKTRFGFALDIIILKNIFSFSGWLMASAFFRNLSHQVDRLLMPRLLSVTALGAYNRPKDFIEQISTKLNGIFDTVLFPVLSGIQDDFSALRSAFNRSMSIMNSFALLMAMGFMFNSGLLIRIFFGEQWLSLQPVFLILSVSLIFNINGRMADCYLRSMAMTKQQFYFRIMEFLINTFGVFVSYKWGIFGIAISIVITSSFTKIVKIAYIGNKVGISLFQIGKLIVLSWRYSLLLLPIFIFSFVLLPRSVEGDIIMTIIYVTFVIIVFLFMPKLVGKQYYEEIYIKLLSFKDRLYGCTK